MQGTKRSMHTPVSTSGDRIQPKQGFIGLSDFSRHGGLNVENCTLAQNVPPESIEFSGDRNRRLRAGNKNKRVLCGFIYLSIYLFISF